ncbi:hypothetical protein, conserved [Babesia bigemina]|uniref:tRNA(Phe) 7-[(3-amino-3-carboxypropyl)-4-demethylwyosine(37)-N(4)]-methyltransferase n=1 Tax=Babesia bigemina TaxID=5866 RepID=A0A061D1I0_BABBI|nr:hypothetical protein, conserved [Babesia bigemina]CDR93977.1 hypothetical protein, conserved [Babesia bigemina]|eukprot:XP_012766163.1 hypothetical protein, conserved [Babesia bigemina]
MRTDPKKVAAILGEERLELLYLGTEHLAGDSSAAVRREVQSAHTGFGERDVVADGIYRNLQHILRSLKEKRDISPGHLAAELRDTQSAYNGLDPIHRNYINGCAGVDDGVATDSTSGGNDTVDRSLKGSVDVILVPLLRLLMRTGRFVSTSCCSGRVAIFECNAEHATAATKSASDFGRAGRFLYTSHCHLDHKEALSAASAVNADVKCKRDCYHKEPSTYSANEEPKPAAEATSLDGSARHPCEVVLKFEAFVLHVECASMQDATTLLQLVRGCGLKKSGIITCTKRVIVSITGSNILETPIAIRHYIRGNYGASTESGVASDGVHGPNTPLGATFQAPSNDIGTNERVETQWLVSQDQFMYLLATCNRKLTGSIRQMLRLYWSCVNHFGIDILQPFSIRNKDFASGGMKDKSKSGQRGCATEKDSRRPRVHKNVPHTATPTRLAKREEYGLCNAPAISAYPATKSSLLGNAPKEGVTEDPSYICTWYSQSSDAPAYEHDPSIRPYIAVKAAQYIKPLKTRLEQHRLYDKTRKIVTNLSVSVVGINAASDNATSQDLDPPTHESNCVSASHDVPKEASVAAFIPIVAVKDDKLKSLFDQSDPLVDFVFTVNGAMQCRLTATEAATADN